MSRGRLGKVSFEVAAAWFKAGGNDALNTTGSDQGSCEHEVAGSLHVKLHSACRVRHTMGRRKRRKRRGYVRPSRASPKQGWSSRQLAQLSGTPLRTIRQYLQRGVLPRSPFKGSATRYQRRQLLALLAIRRLRATDRLSLAEIRKRLLALSESEVEALATEGLAPGGLADALGIIVTNSAAPIELRSATSEGLAQTKRASADLPDSPRWARLELALGLELHVRSDVSPRVLALAAHLRMLCATGLDVYGP
jgi:DNA-binding transcriptional MerR regulator